MSKGAKVIDGTTEQQKLFAYAFFNNKGNGTDAAIKAGYSKKSAAQVASRLLTYAKVQDIIKELNAELKERAIVTKEEIARELYKIGFSDIRKIFDENSRLLPIQDLTDEAAAALASVEVDQLWGMSPDGRIEIGDTKKVKLFDKLKALAQLTELYGFNAPIKSEVKNINPIEIIQLPHNGRNQDNSTAAGVPNQSTK